MTSTRTIAALLEIMDDPDIATRLRIDAAEALLGFEAPDDAVIRAREFLIAVFENKEETISDRIEALKLSRKSEAPKIASKIVRLDPPARTEADHRAAWRHYEMDQLKVAIYRATGNTPPP